jgi:MFS family permease
MISFWFNEKYGRRAALIVAGILFDIGVILQIASHGNVAVFYVGRIISGLGIGGSSFVVPQYLSENSPAIARGALIGCVSTSVFQNNKESS